LSNLANKPPTGLKKPKTKKNAKYLDKTRKSSDLEAIPLCDGHHQALWDKSKAVAIHDNKKKWRELYGADWSYSVQDTQI